MSLTHSMAHGFHRFTVIALLSATLPLIQCTELTKVDWTLIPGAGMGGASQTSSTAGGASGAADSSAGSAGTPEAGSPSGRPADDPAGAGGTAAGGGGTGG